MTKKLIIGSVVLLMLGILMTVVGCNNTLPSDPDEYIKIVHNGATKIWADTSVDSSKMLSSILFENYSEPDIDIQYYFNLDHVRAFFPTPYPFVDGTDDVAGCTIVENTTDANYVTLSVTFNPAKNGYTSIECRAKKDW